MPRSAWHDSNMFWSLVCLAISLVLTVVAAMKGDLRWLLWLALPVGIPPIWHVANHLGRRHGGRIEIFLFFFVPFTVFLYWAYVELAPNDRAIFHVVGGNFGFNRENLNQLIANIYIKNDAGDADMVTYTAAGFPKDNAGPRDVIADLRGMIVDAEKTGIGQHYRVRRNEIKWVTVAGPILPDEVVMQFKKGDFPFYYMASITIKEQETVRKLEHCGFALGNKPGVMHDCPFFVTK